MSKQWSFRALAVLLVLSLLTGLSEQGLLTLGDNSVSVYASGDNAVGVVNDYITYNGTLDLSTVGDEQTVQEESDSSPPSDNPDDSGESEANPKAAAKLYRDGMIHIFNYRQLSLIGSDEPLTDGDKNENTVGKGVILTEENGKAVTYSGDAKYFLEGDIALPANKTWSLPEDFSGEFTSEERQAEKDAEAAGEDDAVQDKESRVSEAKQRVYDADADTVFIMNIYQLATLAADNREEIPVMSNDWNPEMFGTGQLIYYSDESRGYITYGTSHNYVISSEFTAVRPEQEPISLRGGASSLNTNGGPRANPDISLIDGRDYFGQPAVTINGTEYILIGCRRQLEAINYGRVDALGVRHDIEVSGPVYEIQEEREHILATSGDNTWHIKSAKLIYPGDADLVDGIYIDDGCVEPKNYNFGTTEEMYADNNGILNSDKYHSLSGGTRTGNLTNTAYCTVDDQGRYYIESDTGDGTLGPTSNPFDLKYTIDGNYIVFRDINLNNANWTPLMFSGEMYGVKIDDQSEEENPKLWDAGKTQMNLNTRVKPVIAHFNVVPATHDNKLDVEVHQGVGFFATIGSEDNRGTFIDDEGEEGITLTEKKSVVRNIKLYDGIVNNPCTECYIKPTVLNFVTSTAGTALGVILDPILNALLTESNTNQNINSTELLSSLLDARRQDPSSLATGAFAGRIYGYVEVSDCVVEDVSVTAKKTSYELKTKDNPTGKMVGLGGFVGSVSGKFNYRGLGAVGTLLDALQDGLNVIPFLGLGDLVGVVKNVLPIDILIPTGYNNAVIERCSAVGCTVTAQDGKIGVGGFAGTACGTNIRDCLVTRSANHTSLTINAGTFGGGFAGIVRDDIIKATLADLKIIVGNLYPQSEVVSCSIINYPVTVTGDSCLGGFIGAQANSSAVNCTIDAASPVTINAEGDCIGGFTGKVQLGSSFGIRDYLPMNASLISTLTDVVTQLLSENPSQALLAMGGIAQSGVVACRVESNVDVATTGNRIGGLVGEGSAAFLIHTKDIGLIYQYEEAGNRPSVPQRSTGLSRLVSVQAVKNRGSDSGYNFAGGAAGYMISANAGSLLGSTVGIDSTLPFRMTDVDVHGVSGGYIVKADGDYAGGVIGFGIGGDVINVNAYDLKSVTGSNHVGGFGGTTGPDMVVGGNGLSLSLVGQQLLSINNLLNVSDGIHSTFEQSNVTGIASGYTVKATGTRDEADSADKRDFTAGGYVGDCTSVTIIDCHAVNLLSVESDMRFGKSGGFVGHCAAGNLSAVNAGDENQALLLKLDQIVQLETDIIPKLERVDVSFHYEEDENNNHTCMGFVRGNAAGGFVGEFQSGTLNLDSAAEGSEYLPQIKASPYAVYHLDHVEGGKFAGGFGGKVFSGALERDGGSGLALLGGNVKIDLGGLTSITNAYLPKIYYAGVNSESGFTVLAAHINDPENHSAPATLSFAGGYIGYGSGMEVSHCDVRSLKRRTPNHPSDLEEKDGTAYMTFTPGWDTVPYSVAGATYAGGYIGFMNVGSARALGDSIKLLNEDIRSTSLLKGLEMVISTIEESDVYGLPGGFSVLASSHVNLGDGLYDEKGVGYAGGFAGSMAGAHIQHSSAYNFSYIIGEIAAGGYVGEMIPGNVADILDYDESSDGTLSEILGGLLSVDDTVSVVQSFVPTIYNSVTTCIPCGGAVRAQSLSDGTGALLPLKRGYAGGYVGHTSGGQIWGTSGSPWMAYDEDEYPEANRQDCDAIRIRSVYGAEYAGGYVGLMESASTAQGGSLSLLGGLISVGNLLNALDVVYPSIERANVYGPLEKLTAEQWNSWYEYVGKYGGFALDIGRVADQAALDAILDNYVYGYHVVAGRDVYEPGSNTVLGGCGGGFAGAMHSGVIRYSSANNAKQVRAMRSAGGFVGEMQTKGLAEFGDVNLLGLNLDLGSLVSAANILVPVIFESGVKGYQNGLIVTAEGLPTAEETYTQDNQELTRTVNTACGMAGGYVGACYGGQIGTKLDGKIDFVTDDENNTVAKPLETNDSEVIGAWALNLKTVKGTNCIGGFVGKTSAASVAKADSSEASNGLVQGILDTVISNPSQLVSLLGATITVIGKAEVTAASTEWGIVVDGEYKDSENNTKYARCAGGFVGSAEATVFGSEDDETRTLMITHLRGVSGGQYAGGFFGLANVGSVAQVGSSDSNTNLLDLVDAGDVNVLNVFRTYIYNATVNCVYVEKENPENPDPEEPDPENPENTIKELQAAGPEDGLRIIAHDHQSSGRMSTYRLSGCAGGFGGAMMDGTVLRSHVMTLNYTMAPNNSGGFIGLCGSSGGIGTDEIAVNDGSEDPQGNNVLSLLGLGDLDLNAKLLNVVPSVFTDCSVTGFDKGFMTITTNIQTTMEGELAEVDVKGSCSAGFAGFAEMGHFTNCTAENLKIAGSPQIAGGFMGRSAMNYLVEADVDSALTRAVIGLVQGLLGIVDTADLLNLTSDDSLMGLQLLSKDNILYVNLFGLEIGVSKGAHDVWIGSTRIDLDHLDEENVRLTLIEGTRTEADNCSVTGISDGYDVFAGGADEDNDGTDALGYAGGFIGYNDAGKISNSYTELCDVIHGTPNEDEQPVKVGPFSGYTDTRSRTLLILEGENNHYNIYRSDNGSFTEADTSADNGKEKFADAAEVKVSVNGESCNRYEVEHLVTTGDNNNTVVVRDHAYLKDAVESNGGNAGSGGNSGSGDSSGERDLKANVSNAKEILMLNVPLDHNGLGDTPITTDLKDPCDEEFELTINKVWRDFIYLGSRPETIEVNVTRILCDEKPDQLIVFGNEGNRVGETLVLDNSSGSTWTTTWQGSVGRFPVAFRQTDDQGNETVKYYQYYVNEVNFGNHTYKAYYEADQDSGTVTITNRYTGPLIPKTGGEGVLMFYALGLLMLVGGTMLLVLIMTPERKRKLGVNDVELSPSDFSDFLKKTRKKK